ncbi:MAG: LysR family transcriptional regulator [Marinobacterium sp.]|nr:LysR family transcriptional regulator [Marinobacterium sp.]
MKPRISLEQWQALLAVVDKGGYAQAATQLHKSQSAVSYAIARMESLLGLKVFELEGRKAVLTTAGQALYLRARSLVEEAALTEQLALQFSQGIEAEIRLAVDTIVPETMILEALQQFADEAPLIRVQILETVLSGTDTLIHERQVDLAMSGIISAGQLTTPLLQMTFMPVAHPEHPLHQLKRPATSQDLRRYRQLVVRDSGPKNIDAGWLRADQRWTFSTMAASISAARKGLGYAWYPLLKITDELNSRQLAILPLEEDHSRKVQLNMIQPRGEFSGPGTQRLAALLKQQAVHHQHLQDTLCPTQPAPSQQKGLS